MDNPQLLFAQPLELGEGPLWDHRTQTLYWLNVLAGEVWRSRFVEDRPSEPEVSKPSSRVSCLGLGSDGRLVAAFENGIGSFAWGGTPTLLGASLHQPETMALNDGKVGPDGGFWFGAKDRAHAQGIAPLQRLRDGRIDVIETGLTISNGLDWSPDRRWFYLTDSPPRVIWRYRYDPVTGQIADRERFADGAVGPGVPDGLAVDAEGCVWSARWGGSQLVRISPTGEVVGRVAFPVSRVSSCIFGGSDLRTLFVTSAREDFTPEERRAETLAGSVFALRVEVPGLPSSVFSL